MSRRRRSKSRTISVVKAPTSIPTATSANTSGSPLKPVGKVTPIGRKTNSLASCTAMVGINAPNNPVAASKT